MPYPFKSNTIMYFPLEVNEQLANAMRTAATFKVEVDGLLDTIFKNMKMSKQKDDFEKMSDGITDMICTIGETIGSLIAEDTLIEINKQLDNNLNSTER